MTVVEWEKASDRTLDPQMVQLWRTQGPEEPSGFINGVNPLHI